MARPVLLVDGTNVSWAWARSRPLMVGGDFAGAQRLLVGTALRSPLRGLYQELLFVFDGPPAPGGPGAGRHSRVLHPDIGHSGDERLLELIAQHRHGNVPAVLASSDRGLRDAARALGATAIGAADLIASLDPGSGRAPSEESEEDPSKPSPSARDTEAWLARFQTHRRRRDDGGDQKEGDSR